MFTLFDYKKTDLYHGPNRDDEYYETDKNLKKPLHRRKQKRPTIEEFWTSTEPQSLKLCCDDQADYRRFKHWLKKQLGSITPESQSFNEKYAKKFYVEAGITHGDFKEKAHHNHWVAAFHHDFTDYFTTEENKAYKGWRPEKVE